MSVTLPTEQQRRAGARGFFDTAASMFDALGLTDAAAGIRHYRDGSGTDERWSDADASRHPLIDAGRRSNQARFESRTFTGLSSKTFGQRTFRDLKDGESLTIKDDWDRTYDLEPRGSGFLEKLSKPFRDAWALGTNPDTYLRFGRFGVRSNGTFTGTRRGNELFITGYSDNELGPGGDRLDFNPGQPGHAEARTLERTGEARPFNTFHSNRSKVEAVGQYEPDGSLTVRRSTWDLLR